LTWEGPSQLVGMPCVATKHPVCKNAVRGGGGRGAVTGDPSIADIAWSSTRSFSYTNYARTRCPQSRRRAHRGRCARAWLSASRGPAPSRRRPRQPRAARRCARRRRRACAGRRQYAARPCAAHRPGRRCRRRARACPHGACARAVLACRAGVRSRVHMFASGAACARVCAIHVRANAFLRRAKQPVVGVPLSAPCARLLPRRLRAMMLALEAAVLLPLARRGMRPAVLDAACRAAASGGQGRAVVLAARAPSRCAT